MSIPTPEPPVLDDFRPATPPGAALSWRQVHLWTVDLRPPERRVDELRRLLTASEIARAERFHFPRHRRRFAVRRGTLRLLAGAYLDRDPAAIAFGEGEKGKPFVVQGGVGERERLHFNLTDSKDLAIYAFTRGAELGVDVEVLRPMPDAEAIAERFFSLEEREALRAVPEARKALAFFHCWTRKEAYIKAIGEGLSEPLGRFCVTLVPGEPARFVHLGGDRSRAAEWSLLHLEPENGAVGALALHGEGWKVTGCYRLPSGG